MNWLKRIFTIPASSRALIQHVVDAEIDSIFDHNPPEQIYTELGNWLAGTPLGNSALGSVGTGVVLSQLLPYLQRKDSAGAKKTFKEWVHGRLGVK